MCSCGGNNNCNKIRCCRGATGVSGAIGPTGASGAVGLPGQVGATGIVGMSGATGASGAIGLIGQTGSTGADGLPGAIGATGPSGLTGQAGATGADGLVGSTGASGVSGLNGPGGATGPSGLVGPVGATGASGLTGQNGSPGPSGLSGATGATGPAAASTVAMLGYASNTAVAMTSPNPEGGLIETVALLGSCGNSVGSYLTYPPNPGSSIVTVSGEVTVSNLAFSFPRNATVNSMNVFFTNTITLLGSSATVYAQIYKASNTNTFTTVGNAMTVGMFAGSSEGTIISNTATNMNLAFNAGDRLLLVLWIGNQTGTVTVTGYASAGIAVTLN